MKEAKLIAILTHWQPVMIDSDPRRMRRYGVDALPHTITLDQDRLCQEMAGGIAQPFPGRVGPDLAADECCQIECQHSILKVAAYCSNT